MYPSNKHRRNVVMQFQIVKARPVSKVRKKSGIHQSKSIQLRADEYDQVLIALHIKEQKNHEISYTPSQLLLKNCKIK